MFRPGDLILSEDPFVYTVSSNQVEERCYNCLQALRANVVEPSRCSACKYARYCSIKCQRGDWKTRHKLECPALKFLADSGFQPPDHFLLMLKLLLKTDNSYSRSGFCEPSKNSHKRAYDDLVNHREDLQLDTAVMEYIPQIRLILAKYIGVTHPFDLPPPELILEMFGKVKCNSYGILDDDMLTCGVGLYLNSSVFDHSCSPNACQVFDGPRLAIRAIEDIASLDQVHISYIDRFVPLKIRQDWLREGYFFTCSCSRCSDLQKDAEMFSLKCENLSCESPVPSDGRATQPCPSCGFVSPDGAARIQKYNEIAENVVQPSSKAANAQEAEIMLNRAKYMFHPMNPLLGLQYLAVARSSLADASLGSTGFSRAAQIYRYWLPSPAVDPLMGWIFLQAASDCCAVDQEQARNMLKEAENILKVTHGHSHPLYRQIPRLLTF